MHSAHYLKPVKLLQTPQTSTIMSDCDWKPIVFDRRRPGGGVHGETKKQTVKKAIRDGYAVTSTRQRVGSNKSATFTGAKNMRKLDEATDEFKHETVSRSFAKALQQARMAKSMNQKMLAQAINEKPTVINSYEQGKAMPNGVIINKLNKALGCRLPSATGKGKKSSKSKL